MNCGRILRGIFGRGRRGPERETIDLREDDLFDVLAADRRRAVVRRLATGDGEPRTAAGLAVRIAADEAHMDPAVVPPGRVRPVEGALRAEHLPRLAAAGLVDWDEGGDEVRPREGLDAVARLLREVDRRVTRDPVFGLSTWVPRGAPEPRRRAGARNPTVTDGGRRLE